MANAPRSLIVFDGSFFHVTWKCHNNDWLLSSEFAKELYYKLLLKYKGLYGVEIFSYCFMDNHPHLTGKCTTQKLFSDFFRVVNSCFAKTLNKHLRRKGQAVMDRFKSPVMQTDEDIINVMIYNDLNPTRTVQKRHPGKHKWSSYHYYAYGRKDPLITEPVWYVNLGSVALERQQKYRFMVAEILKNDRRIKKCPYRSRVGRLLCFIGSPGWVKRHYQALQGRIALQREDWRRRREDFLRQAEMEMAKIVV